MQVAEVDQSGTYITKTPQYVVKNFIYGADGTFASRPNIIDTKDFNDYNARLDLNGDPVDEIMEVSGRFSGTDTNHTGTVSAYCAETKNRITITSVMEEAEYCVGFYRRDKYNINESAPALYLDCKKEMPFYAVDIALPSMYLLKNIGQTKTFILFLTVLEQTVNDDFNAQWSDETYSSLLEEPKDSEDIKIFNEASVVGYHFDRKAELYEVKDGKLTGTGLETTIRIQKDYNYETGGAKMSYQHVAPLSEGAASVVHPITDFFDATGNPVTIDDFSTVTTVHGKWGKCSNGGKSGFISFSEIPDTPFYQFYTDQVSGAEQDYVLEEALSKGYSTKLNVLFVQASESGDGGMRI